MYHTCDLPVLDSDMSFAAFMNNASYPGDTPWLSFDSTSVNEYYIAGSHLSCMGRRNSGISLVLDHNGLDSFSANAEQLAPSSTLAADDAPSVAQEMPLISHAVAPPPETALLSSTLLGVTTEVEDPISHRPSARGRATPSTSPVSQQRTFSAAL
ncbi:hypothetical protein C8T65DRAFT_698946 [Cerioporus squamosus]|nr:hypothetical protein C8T65DRAFT_698946 [Cerioporus squamosus]